MNTAPSGSCFAEVVQAPRPIRSDFQRSIRMTSPTLFTTDTDITTQAREGGSAAIQLENAGEGICMVLWATIQLTRPTRLDCRYGRGRPLIKRSIHAWQGRMRQRV